MATRYIGGEAILVPVRRSPRGPVCPFRLNDVGTFVWNRIDGSRTVAELVSAVCEEYAAEPAEVRCHVGDFLGELEEIGAVDLLVVA
jgi:hypothetical protein